MNHAQSQESLAGYVLGSLDRREQEELLAHVESCISCFLRAQDDMEVASFLAGGIPEAEAPASLRDRVLSTYARRSVDMLRSLVKMEIWSPNRYSPSARKTSLRWAGGWTPRPKR